MRIPRTERHALGIPRAISNVFRAWHFEHLRQNPLATPYLPRAARIVSATGWDAESENVLVHGPFKRREEVQVENQSASEKIKPTLASARKFLPNGHLTRSI